MTNSDFDHRDHWQILFDSKYLRWFHLQGKECTVTVDKVERDVELTMQGGVKKKSGLVHFVGKEKPLVLNKTNARMIARIHGNKPTEWKGKQLVLYPTTTKMYDQDTKQMQEVGCIRIKPVMAKATSSVPSSK